MCWIFLYLYTYTHIFIIISVYYTLYRLLVYLFHVSLVSPSSPTWTGTVSPSQCPLYWELNPELSTYLQVVHFYNVSYSKSQICLPCNTRFWTTGVREPGYLPDLSWRLRNWTGPVRIYQQRDHKVPIYSCLVSNNIIHHESHHSGELRRDHYLLQCVTSIIIEGFFHFGGPKPRHVGGSISFMTESVFLRWLQISSTSRLWDFG